MFTRATSWLRHAAGSPVGVRAAGSITIGEPAVSVEPEIVSWLKAVWAAPLADPGDWAALSGSGCVPRQLAYAVPAVRKGLLTYQTIGSFPLRRWRGDTLLSPGTLLSQPETWCPVTHTLAMTVRDLILYPHAWWMVTEREWTGYPRHVQRLDPEYVQVETEPGTEDKPARVFTTFQGREVPEADLIRFDGPDLGLLHHGAGALLTALRLEAAANRYASPDVPTGALTNTGEYQLTDDEADALLDDWAISRQTRNTAYLGNVKYEVYGFDPTQLQLVEAREESAVQIARTMGLPARYVNASSGDSLTYSTVTEERRDLVDISFAPYLSAIEQRLSMSDRNGSPAGTTVRFDLNAFLRGSPADRATRAATLIPLGVMSPEEARQQEPDLSGPPPAAAATPPAPAAPVGASMADHVTAYLMGVAE